MTHRWWVGILGGFYALLWTGGVVAHLLWGRTPAEAGWAAPAFLACGAALVFLGAKSGRGWLAATGAGGFLSEVVGIRVPSLYGSYSYTEVVQPQVAGVPVVMACAWVIVIGYVKNRLRLLALKPWSEVFAGAVWMTAIDLLIDPVATLGVGYWVWRNPGPYYGVPLSNFLGWLIVSAALLAAGRRVRVEGEQYTATAGFTLNRTNPRIGLRDPATPWRRRRSDSRDCNAGDVSPVAEVLATPRRVFHRMRVCASETPHWIGLSVIVFFGLLATTHRLWWPAIVALALATWDGWLSVRICTAFDRIESHPPSASVPP